MVSCTPVMQTAVNPDERWPEGGNNTKKSLSKVHMMLSERAVGW